MKRIRTIKPEFFTSEDITTMPRDIRLTFIGLWLYVDDYGNENAKESLIKAAVWPEDDDITIDTVAEHLLYLAEHDQISFYKVGTRNYLSISAWAKHQRVDKPSKSNVPGRPVTLATDSREPVAMEGKGERAGDRGEGTRDESGTADAEGREAGTSRAPTDRPSAFCSAHPEGTLTPCRACGNARLLRKDWETDLLLGVTPTPRPTPTVQFDEGNPDDLPY